MPDSSALPKPEKRRSFKLRDVDNRFAEQAGRCKGCGCDLNLSGYERDHVVRHDALGKTDYDNLQLLCPPCHAVKSRKDNRESKKGARVRREKGQQARRATHGSTIQSRGFAKMPEGRDPKKWQSAGFDKTKTRGFDGKVKERAK